MMITIVLLGLIIWTIASVGWFFMSLGRKNKHARWYDCVLCPPVITLATIVGWVSTLFGWNK